MKISSKEGYLDIRLSEDGDHMVVAVAVAEYYQDGRRKELKVNSIKVKRVDFEECVSLIYGPAEAGEREDTDVDKESFAEDGS